MNKWSGGGDADYPAQLVTAVFNHLQKHPATIATAESCTGGLIGHWLTNQPGISQFYIAGIVAYSNSAKIDFLGVQAELLERYGAVSPQVAHALAENLLTKCQVDFTIATTGIAGPEGGSTAKPVGLIFVAGCARSGRSRTHEYRLTGNRVQIKQQAACHALQCLYDLLTDSVTNGSNR